MNRSLKTLPFLFILTFLIVSAASVSAVEEEKTFPTKYTLIHYAEDKDLDDMIWRLGGQRLEINRDSVLASSRVDRLVERVEAILGIWPGELKINIYLKRGDMQANNVAYYEYKSRAIFVNVEKVTDGVLAHELAHAIINQGFNSLLPSKMQEILTQYVDKYLWSDY